MASDLEEQKKLVLPFMQRAQEIQQADPKVSYYCRMYAVDQALKLPHRAKEITSLLSVTLNQLERDKAHLKLDPVSDRIHCLGFALRIFDNADRVDRAGRATERTSRAYYAASVFIEILNQFEGGVDSELLEKQRYCAWRAAEIRKAVREGRQPMPPPSAAPPAGAAAGVSPATVTDLPPASGSSDWAYGKQNQLHAPSLLPLPSGDSSFSGTSELSFGSIMGPSYTNLNVRDNRTDLSSMPLPPLHERAPPPSTCSSFGQRDAAAAAVGTSAYSSTARFWPGTRLLVHTEEGLEEEATDGSSASGDAGHHPGTKVGTVGQVIRRPDGGYSYKVALTDRLVEVPDEAAVLALQEGGVACLLPQQQPAGQQQQQAPVLVKVLIINYAPWPPTYLVQTPDGKEHVVAAQELMPPPRETNTTATITTPPPQQLPSQPAPSAPACSPPPPPSDTQQHQQHLPPSVPRAAMPSAPSVPPHPALGFGTPSALSPYPSVAGSAAPSAYQQSYPSATPAPAIASASYTMAPSLPSLPPGYKPPLQVIMDAQKQAKYAVSALSFEDIHTAVKHLSEALRLLTSPPPAPATHIGHGR
ncbi:hypothetical protein VaNZ11_001413 [Volvox africanus]|uniref:Vta1/callose synthase N-terminal domain-containing protein n=1 Tax=Volvox africanus TaxID=51714 RepID=A0ABQ5RPZ2_9CHLO|nr:hypothetical protein VaNZ11_001413 [Volvox africanus]